MSDKDLTIDLSNEQEKNFGAKKIELASDEDITLTFDNDIEGQIVYAESGDNVVVTAYGTYEVASWQKTETFISTHKDKKGYDKSVTYYTYQEEVEEGQSHWVYDHVDNSWSKTKGTGQIVTSYIALDENSKALYSQATEPTSPEGGVYVDTKTVLGTVTYTNGKNAEGASVTLISDVFAKPKEEGVEDKTVSLLTEYYSPAYNSKKKTYTGSWLNEKVDSTSLNETFSLGTGNDVISYDLSKKQGADTINLVKGSRVTINLLNAEDVIWSYTNSGNNVVMKGIKKADLEYDYQKVVYNLKGNKATITYYDQNDEGTGFETQPFYSDTMIITNQVKKSLGLKKGVNTIYFLLDKQSQYTVGETKKAPIFFETVFQTTFKNYLALEDGESIVFSDDTTLKSRLEAYQFGNPLATKAQKLTGTFLDEHFIGGLGNDTITTGVGTDIIRFSGGKDTVTINGTGAKQIDMSGAQATGTTTATFAKGVKLEETSLDVNFDVDNTKFIKSGSDLIVTQTTEVEEGKFTTANVNVKNYFTTPEDVVTFNYSILKTLLADDVDVEYLYQNGNAKKANTIYDTNYHDYITGGNKADKIYLDGRGNDVVIGGAGNDIFYVGEDAQNTKTFKFTKGSGADTLTINSNSSAEIVLDNDALYSNSGGEVSFEKTGSSLIMKTYYPPASKKTKAVTDTVNVTNYFGEIASPVKFAQSSSPENAVDLDTVLEDNYLIVNGMKSGKTMVYEGTDLKDSMTYTGSGKATMAGGGNDDSYTVKVTKTSDVVVTDTDGMNVLNLLNKASDIRIFFNADKDGTKVNRDDGGGEYETTDFLWIYNKNAVNLKNIAGANTGKITVEHCFADDGVTSAEHFSTVTALDSFNISQYVQQIAYGVATWFSQGSRATDYSDAMDVFDPLNQNAADKESLLAVYNQAYDSNFQMP